MTFYNSSGGGSWTDSGVQQDFDQPVVIGELLRVELGDVQLHLQVLFQIEQELKEIEGVQDAGGVKIQFLVQILSPKREVLAFAGFQDSSVHTFAYFLKDRLPVT